jgi:2-polyprenyl-3-methyl-5-hydroxy-6-metoxy-1,4-benzoquinol methylase
VREFLSDKADLMNISEIAQNLVFQDGIWVSKKSVQIAYPAEANKVYSEIEENSFWFNHRNKIILKAIQCFSPSSKHFFDIGGGNGFTGSFLSKSGYKTILVEPGEDGIRIAKQRGVDHLINSSLQDAGFLKGVLPTVGLFDVLEHIEDDLSFLKQVESVLTNSGIVFITVPAFNNLWSQNDVNAQHYRRYTTTTFTKVAEAAGFKIIYATYFFRFLPFGLFLFRSLPYRFGIKFKSLYSKATKEHKSSFASKLINFLGKSELNAVEKMRAMNIGSSCLFVLRKDK